MLSRVCSSLRFGKRDTGFFDKKAGILGFFRVLVRVFIFTQLLSANQHFQNSKFFDFFQEFQHVCWSICKSYRRGFKYIINDKYIKSTKASTKSAIDLRGMLCTAKGLQTLEEHCFDKPKMLNNLLKLFYANVRNAVYRMAVFESVIPSLGIPGKLLSLYTFLYNKTLI
jgi:serine phosphatase RsbU (regulator of sigma subunit)